jgi:hypothetical protein
MPNWGVAAMIFKTKATTDARETRFAAELP